MSSPDPPLVTNLSNAALEPTCASCQTCTPCSVRRHHTKPYQETLICDSRASQQMSFTFKWRMLRRAIMQEMTTFESRCRRTTTLCTSNHTTARRSHTTIKQQRSPHGKFHVTATAVFATLVVSVRAFAHIRLTALLASPCTPAYTNHPDNTSRDVAPRPASHALRCIGLVSAP